MLSILPYAEPVIYSKWLPDRGGYAYYESAERLGLGDDLPAPFLKNVSDLGVASTHSGRPLPLGAKFIGYGKLARGSIVPFDRMSLSGITIEPTSLVFLTALGVAAALGGVFVVRSLKNR